MEKYTSEQRLNEIKQMCSEYTIKYGDIGDFHVIVDEKYKTIEINPTMEESSALFSAYVYNYTNSICRGYVDNEHSNTLAQQSDFFKKYRGELEKLIDVHLHGKDDGGQLELDFGE